MGAFRRARQRDEAQILEDCLTAMAESFTIGAFAVILDDQGRVLLCHRRDRDLWNLPGGGMQPGELPTDTVRRETLEETGLRVYIERLVGVYAKPDVHDLVFCFQCRVCGGEPMLSDEADEIAYFRPEEIPANTVARQVERIHDALAHVEAVPLFRMQSQQTAKISQAEAELSSASAASEDDLKLVDPSLEYEQAFLQMLADYHNSGEAFFQNFTDLAGRDFPRYVERLLNYSIGFQLEAGHVPQNTYWLVKGTKILGVSRLRPHLNESLRKQGGNIGYTISPSWRRKGYGTKILALTLQKARLMGLKQVLVTCDADNQASINIIERNGGQLSATSSAVVLHYWIDLQAQDISQ